MDSTVAVFANRHCKFEFLARDPADDLFVHVAKHQYTRQRIGVSIGERG
ncbi:hypothetical protein [Phyllobacterium endophyticum]|nr:hypothetical protein [Phyllobacterium endophyticum]MBB3237511.1 hypothetical protein [Phyllobacterium endophyticum]